MTFYPDVKDGMSPSSLAQWLQSRSSFVKTYFMGEKIRETASMRAGTQIHRLVEAGLIKAKHVFEHPEDELSATIAEGRIFRGRPDSWGEDPESEGNAVFVDYKSGKANGWKEKLPVDIKMRATAFLVWIAAGKPERVKGYIEFIQTTWDPNAHEVVPVDDKETEVESIVYTAEEMEQFGRVILKEMDEVCNFYSRWQQASGAFVSTDDIETYVALEAKIAELEAQRDSVKESIMGQMEFGGEENHPTEHGTFYLTTKETYDYPEELRFLVDGAEEYTLEEADRVASGAKAAKKNFELANEPVSTKTSIGFRPKKAK